MHEEVCPKSSREQWICLLIAETEYRIKATPQLLMKCKEQMHWIMNDYTEVYMER